MPDWNGVESKSRSTPLPQEASSTAQVDPTRVTNWLSDVADEGEVGGVPELCEIWSYTTGMTMEEWEAVPEEDDRMVREELLRIMDEVAMSRALVIGEGEVLPPGPRAGCG